MTRTPETIAASQPSLRVTKGWVIRVAVSALILGALFWFLPWADLKAGFSRISLPLFLGVLALFLVGHMVAALKWWMLIGQGVSYLTALRAHFAGLAANLCLPGVAGGDVVRAGLVIPHTDAGKVAAGSLTDRLVDMLALALVAAMGVLMIGDSDAGGELVAQVAVLFAVVLLASFYLLPRLVPVIYGRIPKLPMQGFATKTAASFGALGKQPVLLLIALGTSFAIQAGFVTIFIWLADAAGVVVAHGAWFFAWPLAKILSVLPISLGGIGLREATLAGLMTPFGAAAAPVVVASLIWQSVLIVAGIIGALAWALSSGQRQSSPKHVEHKEA